jgi:hypothetical protein
MKHPTRLIVYWISKEAEAELRMRQQEQQDLTNKIVTERNRRWQHNDRILNPVKYAV